MNHSVNIDLPKAQNRPEDAKPETVRLSVDASGQYWWNEKAIGDTELAAMLSQTAARNPQPELHIRGDNNVRYERVAQAMAIAQREGMRKIGFVTDPRSESVKP